MREETLETQASGQTGKRERKELRGAPSLSTLYAKALLSPLSRRRGETLPDTEYVRTEVRVDPVHLAAYNRVCGFRLRDELPSTYPHLLVFPLQLSLMTEKSFPFPPIGMVHIANRITQHRPLRLGETWTVRVYADNLRPHSRGKQFDLLAELSTADGPVWTEVSTYLWREGNSGARRGNGLTPPAPTGTWRVPGDLGRRYAKLSGDRNPIHLHPLAARLFGFRSTIAHGMWAKAKALASFEGRLPSAFTVDVRFKRPIPLRSKVAFTSWRTTEGWAFELWNSGKPEPHLEGVIAAATPDPRPDR